ncbi:hypothetical protein ABG067_006768 [Albugo candida]
MALRRKRLSCEAGPQTPQMISILLINVIFLTVVQADAGVGAGSSSAQSMDLSCGFYKWDLPMIKLDGVKRFIFTSFEFCNSKKQSQTDIGICTKRLRALADRFLAKFNALGISLTKLILPHYFGDGAGIESVLAFMDANPCRSYKYLKDYKDEMLKVAFYIQSICSMDYN